MRTCAPLLMAGLLFVLAPRLRAQTPNDVVELFRTAADALSNRDADAFLDHFDRKMPDYEKLHDEIAALLDHSETTSAIEIVSDEGNDQKRALELDWLLQVDQERPRRQIVKCRIERQGKKWKITAFDPVDFFKTS